MNLVRRALVLALLASGAVSATSSAGIYDVYSCSLPNGQAAPTEGWSPETRGTDASAYNGCQEIVVTRGSLSASFYPYAGTSDYAGWVFTAPTDTTISSYTLWRWVHSASRDGGFQDYYLSHEVPRSLDQRYFSEWCTRWTMCSDLGTSSGNHLAATNRVDRSSLQISRVYASLTCRLDGASRCDSTQEAGRVQIYAARFGLSDLYDPIFTKLPAGSLLQTAEPHEGEKAITFGASDRGGGIEHVGIVVDGQTRVRRAADPNARRCRRPFTALKPCPAATENTLLFDTATLPNGPHAIQASVTDAAATRRGRIPWS